MNKFDYCIFIGRFQPYHFGHDWLVNSAFELSHNLIIVIGSANGKERNLKNPWNYSERQNMISDSLSIDKKMRTSYIYQPDVPGDDNEWANSIREKVSIIIDDAKPSKNIALIGHNHDASSFYLKMFPEWTLIEKENADQFPHATNLRDWYFSGSNEWEKFVPNSVSVFLNSFKKTDFYINNSKIKGK